jgi:hypothetical protein
VDNPTTNYGLSTYLEADTDDALESYLLFSISGVTGPIQHAILRVYSTSNGTVNDRASGRRAMSRSAVNGFWERIERIMQVKSVQSVPVIR